MREKKGRDEGWRGESEDGWEDNERRENLAVSDNHFYVPLLKRMFASN